MESIDKKEKKYISMRKRKAFFKSLIYYICRVFPIDKKKIVMWTFEGLGGYGCSPKYIAQEILKRKKGFKIIWLVNDISKEFPAEIKKVKSTFLNRAFHLSTAKFWISNTRTFYGTKKRNGTIYIQTWHATMCIKPIGRYRGKLFPKIADIVSEADSKQIDYVLSGSQWCDDMYRKGLIYDGKIVRTGTPRCDVLYNETQAKHEQLRTEYNLPSDAKIILYAPTFRGGSQKGSRSINCETTSLNLAETIQAFEEKFGGSWYIFMRLHPQLAAQIKDFLPNEKGEKYIDVSQRPDMNEIIAASDAFLTDYSSAIFEAAMANLPSFIYADDLEDYIGERGDLFFDIKKLPFLLAENNEELKNNILNFDKEKYKLDCDKFFQEVGNMEDGHASERIADLIEQLLS